MKSLAGKWQCCVTRKQVMCIQYWPPSKGKMESYEGIEISYSHEEQLANFVIRNFNVRRRTPVHPSSHPPIHQSLH